MADSHKLLTLQQAAVILGVTENTIKKWVQSKKLKAIMKDADGEMIFRREDLSKVEKPNTHPKTPHKNITLVATDSPERRTTFTIGGGEIEERFRAMIENSADAIALVDKHGKFVYVSPSVKNVLGYTPEELLGKETNFLFPKGHLKKVQNLFAPVFEHSGAKVSVEHKYVHKDGSIRWLESRITNLLDKPEINALVSNFRDITERKLADEKVRESEERFRTLAEAIPQIVYIANQDGNPVYFNHRWFSYTGLPKKFNTDDWVARVHPEDLSLMTKNFEQASQKKEVFSAEYRIKDKKGNYHWFLGRSVPMLDRKKNILRWFGTATDIHEIKEAQHVFQEADELQKRLAAIVESSDDAIISKSREGIIMTWNKGAQQLYGYTPEEIIGKPVSTIMPPEKKDDFPYIMNQLLKGKKVEHYETKRMAKDGRILDVSLTVSPIRNAQGEIIGASKVARDISERKRAEERQNFLERATALLSASIDYETTLKNVGKLIIPDLADYCRIVVVDEKKQIKEISVEHVHRKELTLVKELFTAYKDDKTTGVGKLISTGKPDLMQRMTPKVLAKSTPQIIRLVKELHLKSYMGVPLKIGSRVVGAITFSSTRQDRIYTKADVTLAQELARRAALAIENARLYADAQNAILLRDEFISVASHELKTPVTSLKIYTQVVKKQLEKQNDGFSARSLSKMDDQINKLTTLIEDLLNVSKIQSGKLDFREETFYIDEVVRDAVENIQQTSENHHLVIDGSIKKQVHGDKDRIEQVVTNLITNAIKYSPNADKVIIHLIPEKEQAVIAVEDFGIGIDKEHQKRIFERFYRVNNTEERTFPGLGLGLYISYQIIKRHGGEMSVVSRKGKGSTFRFTMPYKSANSQHERQNHL